MCRSTGLCLVNQTRLHMIALNKADEDTVEKINIKKTSKKHIRFSVVCV